MNKIKQFIESLGQEDMDSESAIDLIRFSINLIPRNVKSILCVGFGGGTELRLLKEKGYKVFGIDYNERNIEKNKEFNVKQGDMHEIDFKDNTFDFKSSFPAALAPF